MKISVRYIFNSVLTILLAGALSLPRAVSIVEAATDQQKPVVNLTAPKEGQKFEAGTTSIRLAGTFTDNQGLKRFYIHNGVKWEYYNVSGTSVDLSKYTVNVQGSEGNVRFTMGGNDIAGNIAYYRYVNVAIGSGSSDTVKPVVNLTSPKDGQKYQVGTTSIKLAGTVTDNKSLKTLSIHDGAKWNYYNVSGTSIDLSKYSVNVQGREGNVRIIVGASDMTNNSATTHEATVVVGNSADTVKPVVKLTAPKDGQQFETGTTSIRLAGTFTDDQNLKRLYIHNGAQWEYYSVSGKNIDLSKYSVKVNGKDCNVRITVGGNDAIGNIATYATANITFCKKSETDSENPIVNLTSPKEGQKYEAGTASIRLAGTVTDDMGLSYLYIYEGKSWKSYKVSGKSINLNSYSANVKGQSGSVRLSVTAKDTKGKYASYKHKTVSIGKKAEVDEAKPVVNVTSPSNGQTFSENTQSISLKGTATDDVGLQYLYLHNGKKWSYYRVSGEKVSLDKYKFDVKGLKGAKRLIVTVRDKSGKFAAYKYINVHIGKKVVDSEKPVVKVTAPSNGEKFEAKTEYIYLKGSVKDDVALRYLYIYNGTRWYYYNVSGKNINLKKYKVHVHGSEGNKRLIVAARDKSGKLSQYQYIRISLGETAEDKAKPVVNVTSPKEKQVIKAGSSHVQLQGSVTDDLSLKYLYLYNGKRWYYYNVSGKNLDLKNYRIYVSGIKGKTRLIVAARDAAGKLSTYKYINVSIGKTEVDKQKPVVNLTAPSNGKEFKKGSKEIRLGGSATDDVALQYLYIHNGSKWTYYRVNGKKVDLSRYVVDVKGKKGKVRIIVTARDKTGKLGVYQYRTVSIGKKGDYDTQRPVVTLTSPKNGFKYNAETTTIKLTGTATDNKKLLYVYVHDGKKWHNYKVSGKSIDLAKYSVDVRGRKGKTRLIVAARDASGKYSIYRYATVYLGATGDVDNTRPVVNLTAPKANQKFKAGTENIRLAGTVTDDVGSEYLYINNGKSWRVYRTNNKKSVDLSNYSANVKGLTGTLRLIVTARDKSGKFATYRYVNVIVDKPGPVDKERPVVRITSPVMNQKYETGTTSVGIEGTVSDDFDLQYFYVYNSKRWIAHKVSGKKVDLSQFKVNTTGLTGNVRLIFTAKDKTGKFAGYVYRNVMIGDGKVDKEHPYVNLTAPGKGQRFDLGTTSIQLGGTATDDVGMQLLYVHNGKRWTSHRVSGTKLDLSKFKVDVRGIKGKVRLAVTARDKIGKFSVYRYVHVVIGKTFDLVKPVVNLTSPKNGQKFMKGISSIGFTGTVSDNVELQYVYIHDGLRWNNYKVSGKSVNLSNYSANVKGRKGNVRLIVAAQDMSGNYATFRYANVVLGEKGKTDLQNPVVKLNFPHNGQKFKAGSKSIHLAGHVSDDTELEYLYIHNGKGWSISKISGKKVNLAKYSVSFSKKEGDVTISVMARDKSGKWSSKVQRKVKLEKK